jgi:hypothetical protein
MMNLKQEEKRKIKESVLNRKSLNLDPNQK